MPGGAAAAVVAAGDAEEGDGVARITGDAELIGVEGGEEEAADGGVTSAWAERAHAGDGANGGTATGGGAGQGRGGGEARLSAI